tara:strand:+ start:717 stop:1433 length:717 start_codon:yes stop_codon:yes gene_type:complete
MFPLFAPTPVIQNDARENDGIAVERVVLLFILERSHDCLDEFGLSETRNRDNRAESSKIVRFVEVDVVVGRLFRDHHKFIFLQLRKRVVDVFGELGLIAIHDNSPDVCEKVVPDEFCDDAPDVLRNNELCVKGGRVAFVIHHRPDDIGVNRSADVEFPGREIARPKVQAMRCLGPSGNCRFHLVILLDDVHLPKLVCEVLENGEDLARRINIPEPVVIVCYLLDPIVIHMLHNILKAP